MSANQAKTLIGMASRVSMLAMPRNAARSVQIHVQGPRFGVIALRWGAKSVVEVMAH